MKNSIYLDRLVGKNIGPIEDVSIVFPFSEDGNPIPVVFVGENGTGKSTIISNIVDSFYEMAGKAFNNANQPNERSGYQFFKTIVPYEIHTGSSFLLSYISFVAEGNPKYIFKAGNISIDEAKKQVNESELSISWKEESFKTTIISKETVSKIWNNNILCYFPPNRYEKPAWMGDKYYNVEKSLHPTINEAFERELKNPIEAQDVTQQNLQWLLDIIADSRADIEGDISSMELSPNTDAKNLFLLKQARNNLEIILSKILGEEVSFQLNYRNSGGSRFRIVRKKDNRIVCPTLDSLSTGQIALFNLFATIVRYADNNDINQSIRLNNITGIVVIDEIELHLHSKLQKEVLPDLIKLFPKIQFVITSHSPLFLLGMEEALGDEGFRVFEMPRAVRISVERFSEFSKAYDYIKETQHYQNEIKNIINSIPKGEKPLVITEGSTDWKHMETAYKVLSSKGEYGDLFQDLNLDFLRYEPKNSSVDAEFKIDMGDNALISLCESLIKIPHKRKYDIIADRDNKRTIKRLGGNCNQYKKWDKGTFSVVLPVPNSRADTPEICIEHYYSDEEIEKEIDVDGVRRHLFMGKDFNADGYNYSLDRFCERKDLCGPDKLCILDGTQGERVRKLSNESDTTNYAIPKSVFAEYVASHADEFDFSSFVPLFELIKEIINEVEHD